MNTNTYLKELRFRLMWHFPAEKAGEIADDYREMFEAGRAQNRDDAELLKSIGSPKEVVRELAREKKENGAASHIYVNGPLAFGVLFIAALFLLAALQHSGYWALVMIPIACIRPFAAAPKLAVRRERAIRALLALFGVISAAALLYALFHFKTEIIDVALNGGWNFPFENPAKDGALIRDLLDISVALSFGIYLLTYIAAKTKIEYYVFSLFSLSVFFFGRLLTTVLMGLDVSELSFITVIRAVFYAELKVIGGALAAALLIIAIRSLAGTGKKHG